MSLPHQVRSSSAPKRGQYNTMINFSSISASPRLFKCVLGFGLQGRLIYICSLPATSSAVRPLISTVFCLLVEPRTILTMRRGTARRSASSATKASFAAPSTGGAVRWTFRFPCSHAMLFFALRGMTLTLISTMLPTSR